MFTLARKVQPCIIFIDEIDSFLRERQASDHEAMAMMKAEFMRWAELVKRGMLLDARVLILEQRSLSRPSAVRQHVGRHWLRRHLAHRGARRADRNMRSRSNCQIDGPFALV